MLSCRNDMNVMTETGVWHQLTSLSLSEELLKEEEEKEDKLEPCCETGVEVISELVSWLGILSF